MICKGCGIEYDGKNELCHKCRSIYAYKDLPQHKKVSSKMSSEIKPEVSSEINIEVVKSKMKKSRNKKVGK